MAGKIATGDLNLFPYQFRHQNGALQDVLTFSPSRPKAVVMLNIKIVMMINNNNNNNNNSNNNNNNNNNSSYCDDTIFTLPVLLMQTTPTLISTV